jgi:hypothetical protein
MSQPGSTQTESWAKTVRPEFIHHSHTPAFSPKQALFDLSDFKSKKSAITSNPFPPSALGGLPQASPRTVLFSHKGRAEPLADNGVCMSDKKTAIITGASRGIGAGLVSLTFGACFYSRFR